VDRNHAQRWHIRRGATEAHGQSNPPLLAERELDQIDGLNREVGKNGVSAILPPRSVPHRWHICDVQVERAREVYDVRNVRLPAPSDLPSNGRVGQHDFRHVVAAADHLLEHQHDVGRRTAEQCTRPQPGDELCHVARSRVRVP
jgi:hypothetical protein